MIAIRYAAGSLDCRLNVVVPVLVVVKHMAVATLFLRTCIKNDYSPDGGQSQGLEPNDWPKLNENDGIDDVTSPQKHLGDAEPSLKCERVRDSAEPLQKPSREGLGASPWC